MTKQTFDGLMDEGWFDKLSPFLLSEKFERIMDGLKKEANAGFVICPNSFYLFRAFKECKYDDLRCIIIGQDPYNTKGIADGVAMSCSLTRKLQPSLKLFYDGINKTVYNGNIKEENYNPDLTYMANQGVLLINVALTVREKEPGSHLDLWREFIEFLCEVINCYNRGLPIIMLGQDATNAVYPLIMPFTHYTFSVEHPAYAARMDRDWDCGEVFNIVNNILRRNNGSEFEIKWI